MKIEEYRNSTPTDIRTKLPKGETKPCMRGVMDIELYNLTGEVKLIEPLEVFVPPVDPLEAPLHNPYVKRKGRNFTMNPNKPSKEALEKDLKSEPNILTIAKKYSASVATVHNWIRGYGLAGIRGKKKDVQSAPPVETVQESPTNEMTQEPTPEPNPGCFSDYNPKMYWCKDCEYMAECLAMFNKIEQAHGRPQCFPDADTEPQGMTEEENMTDAEWEAQQESEKPKIEFACFGAYDADYLGCRPDKCSSSEACKVVTNNPESEAPRETFDEIWSDVRSDLSTLERLYIADAKKTFREKLREMLAEVVGE